jgi:hypothetical protein
MLRSSNQCSVDPTQELPEWFHDYISISDYNLFGNAMTDITGKISLSLDDPRYLHLLNLDIIPCLMILHHYNPSSTLFTYYLNRWRQNNPSTKNLMTLMEIIIKRFNVCITSANRRLGQNQNHLSTKQVKQCCNGLFFVIMMIQYLTLTVVSDEEVSVYRSTWMLFSSFWSCRCDRSC